MHPTLDHIRSLVRSLSGRRDKRAAQARAEHLLRLARADAAMAFARMADEESCLLRVSDDRLLLEVLFTVAAIGTVFMTTHDAMDSRQASHLARAISTEMDRWLPNGWGVLCAYLSDVSRFEAEGLQMDLAIGEWIRSTYLESEPEDQQLIDWINQDDFQAVTGYYIILQWHHYWEGGLASPGVGVMLASDPDLLDVLLKTDQFIIHRVITSLTRRHSKQ